VRRQGLDFGKPLVRVYVGFCALGLVLASRAALLGMLHTCGYDLPEPMGFGALGLPRFGLGGVLIAAAAVQTRRLARIAAVCVGAAAAGTMAAAALTVLPMAQEWSWDHSLALGVLVVICLAFAAHGARGQFSW
jgi:hypothetical protein